MTREYLRVTPTSAALDPDVVSTAIASLHKLSAPDSEGVIAGLIPVWSEQPVTFEFLAMSEGKNEPVEFYYGADTKLDVLQQRLRSIYPDSFDIDRVDVDIVRKLIPPVEQRPAEHDARLEAERLLDPDAVDSATDQNAKIGTDGGTVRARPPLEDATPYGVRWRGSVDRRKDWMTSLTDFSETITPKPVAEETHHSGRAPIAPLIDQLTDAAQPLAFQVVFRRKPDWSKQARRRAGALLAGKDTLLQKILGFGSAGRGRTSASSGRSARSTGRTTSSSHPRRHRSIASDAPSRPTSVDAATRYDLVRANSPKRTFSVNLQVLALAVDEDEPKDVDAYLDPLCSVFDLVDGRFYEMDGRRLRSHGYLSGSGERHARTVLERFRSRSIATGGKRFAITNRSETRPDLVLNGNELANFLVLPPSTEQSRTQAERRGADGRDATPTEGPAPGETTPEANPLADDDLDPELVEGSFPAVPETVIERDAEMNRLANILEPLSRGEPANHALITGPSGSGKTCTTSAVVDKIRRDHPAVEAVYVNCWEDTSRFPVFYRILDGIASTVDIHRQSTPRDLLYERLRDHDAPCVVLLDEADQLADRGLLYDLLDFPMFALLLIVNQEEELLEGLDERLVSRLRGCTRIRFERYAADQLVKILSEQTMDEVDADEFEAAEIERIATASDGDARVAIKTLRLAARRATQSGSGITEDIIELALPQAQQELRDADLNRLSPHQQAVYDVIEAEGRIAPRDLYENYCETVDEPKSERTIRNYLAKLEHYNLITAEGSTHNRIYRTVPLGNHDPNSRPTGERTKPPPHPGPSSLLHSTNLNLVDGVRGSVAMWNTHSITLEVRRVLIVLPYLNARLESEM